MPTRYDHGQLEPLVAAMAMKHLTETLHKMLRAFRSQRSGNVTITFALALIPVIGLVGAAVDYSRANSARTAMQAALDSTALMLSKEAPSLTSTQMTQKANDYFNAMFTRPEALNTTLALNYNATGDSLTLSGSANVNTTFTRVIGKTQMAIGSSTTVKWGMSRLRVALVLDNTGSMADAGKITALKTATKNLLTMLQSAAANNGDVYVSIIPFSKDVNVGGPTNYNASWVNWTDWDANNGLWCKSNGQCSDKQTGNAVWTPNNHNTWNGCVTDRTQNYDTLNTAPSTGIPATLFPAEQYDNCPAEFIPLSYNWTQLNKKVDDMFPNGNTNQAIGLAWGWMSLMTTAPLNAPAMDANYKYQQIIILLTDGLNTQDRWYSDQSSIDARQQILCNNIKAAGITLYTVQVNTGGDPTSTLLQNCASDAGKFFILTSASQIVSTFTQIGTNLTKLRIAK
jgi:Flp pilus assembly protein TadG